MNGFSIGRFDGVMHERFAAFAAGHLTNTHATFRAAVKYHVVILAEELGECEVYAKAGDADHRSRMVLIRRVGTAHLWDGGRCHPASLCYFLFLAVAAIKSGALLLVAFGDGLAASRAGFAVATIDIQCLLKISWFTVLVNKIA